MLRQAQEAEFEIHTVPKNQSIPLWFQVGVQGNYLIISKTKRNSPSVRLSKNRKINYKGRQEKAQKSQNTAYIIALISAVAKQVRI